MRKKGNTDVVHDDIVGEPQVHDLHESSEHELIDDSEELDILNEDKDDSDEDGDEFGVDIAYSMNPYEIDN